MTDQNKNNAYWAIRYNRIYKATLDPKHRKLKADFTIRALRAGEARVVKIENNVASIHFNGGGKLHLPVNLLP